MDFIALQLFCDLIETRSFTLTAERHFVTQSAVSQRLRAMERDYGQSLIERGKGKGRATPTEAGLLLYEGAKPILREIADLDTRMRGLSEEVAGTVRVATVYSVGLHALPGRLKLFLAAHPRVNVHLEYSQTGKVYQDVLSGAVEVGIVACPAPRNGIEVVPFGEETMVVICAPENPLVHEAEAVGGIALSRLDDQPYIAFDDEIPTRRLIDDRLRAAGAKVRIVMAYDNIETIKNLVEIGTGIAIVPENTVRREVREGALAVVPLLPADTFQRPAGLLLKKAGPRRAVVRAFVAAMRAD